MLELASRPFLNHLIFNLSLTHHHLPQVSSSAPASPRRCPCLTSVCTTEWHSIMSAVIRRLAPRLIHSHSVVTTLRPRGPDPSAPPAIRTARRRHPIALADYRAPPPPLAASSPPPPCGNEGGRRMSFFVSAVIALRASGRLRFPGGFIQGETRHWAEPLGRRRNAISGEGRQCVRACVRPHM